MAIKLAFGNLSVKKRFPPHRQGPITGKGIEFSAQARCEQLAMQTGRGAGFKSISKMQLVRGSWRG
jgi:hypothetical protein